MNKMATSFINLCIFYCWRRDGRAAFIKCLRDFGRVTCWRSELSLEQQEGHVVDAESPAVSPWRERPLSCGYSPATRGQVELLVSPETSLFHFTLIF